MALASQKLEAGVVVVVAGELGIGLLRCAGALTPGPMRAGVVLKQSSEVEAVVAVAAAEGPQPQVLVVASV